MSKRLRETHKKYHHRDNCECVLHKITTINSIYNNVQNKQQCINNVQTTHYNIQ